MVMINFLRFADIKLIAIALQKYANYSFKPRKICFILFH